MRPSGRLIAPVARRLAGVRARLLVAVVACAAVCGGWLAVGASGADEQRYTVVLDNAFGLTKGVDLRSSGVRVGKIDKLDVQRATGRALVTVVVQRSDFAGFRKDVFCEVKPQSLIGEYFMDCEPGRSPDPAPSTIPVEQTGGTIPPDLVLDVLRRPARERFGLILSELGIGLAARGDDLQTTIRRGVPALRETQKVLDILYANRRTLNALTREADQVLVKLAGNRDDVARFISAARDTTTASADRRDELAATVRKLPSFLRELRPALADLGTAARLQTPALVDLRAAAPDLTTLLRRLEPFADSARPAVRSLGDASKTGIGAAKEARSTVKELRTLGTRAPEPTRNLRFFLEDIDDRERATERNRLSPGGSGFTGIEAFLQYVFVQSQAINIFDSKSYMLKLSLLVNDCSQYTNAETVRSKPERTRKCNQFLGPTQPGITNATASSAAKSRAGSSAPRTNGPAQAPAATPPAIVPQPQPPAAPKPDDAVGGLLGPLLDALPKIKPKRRSGATTKPAARAASADSERNLLEFLLGP